MTMPRWLTRLPPAFTRLRASRFDLLLSRFDDAAATMLFSLRALIFYAAMLMRHIHTPMPFRYAAFRRAAIFAVLLPPFIC